MVCKLVTVLSRLAGNQGSNFPGRLARRIRHPDEEHALWPQHQP
jgi:hypothetical protein